MHSQNTMRMTTTICVLLSVLLPVSPLARAEVPAPAPVEPGLWFPIGEKLTYRVYWGVIPVGTSVATTEWVEYEGKMVIAVRFRSRTNKVLRKLYPVDDFIESLIDPETFLPLRYTKQLNEGRYHCDEVTHFDHEGGMARFYSKRKDRHKEYPILGDTRDMVSFMYYIRGQAARFKVGEKENFMVMADEKLYDLLVEPLREEKVKLPQYGRVSSVRLEPEASLNEVFVRKGKLWLWVSDDDRRIVIRVQAKVPVASVKILLANVEGPGDDFWIRENKANRGDKENVRE